MNGSFEVNREKEIWAMALWVEKHHGDAGWFYITQQQDHLLAQGEDAGAKLWAQVGDRFDEIMAEPENPLAVN